jgi:hypothetical protein
VEKSRLIQKKWYTDIDLRIVLINSESSLSNDKFHKPQLCNTVLFETLTEPKLYWEFNTCSNDYDLYKIAIDTKWLYNHKPGDIVHFDYLKKYRFFTIDEEHRPKTKNPLN